MIKVKLVRVSACAVLVLGLNSISRSSYATSIVDTGSDSFGPSWSFYNGQNFGGEIFTQYFCWRI